MLKLDRPLAQALVNLQNSADFRAFLSVIESDAAEAQKSLDIAGDMHTVGRCQGKRHVLVAILNAFAAAPAALDKFSKQP